MNKEVLKILIILNLITIAIINSNGQNLIANASFEEVECPENTIASFFESDYWQATGADAYWMHYSCPVDPEDTQAIVAINTQIIPYVGSGYISLEGLIFKNGYCISEGISQRLEKPIANGSFYYLELATLKYGLENPIEEVPSQCSSFTDRGLELRLDNQHIFFNYDSKSVNSQSMICDIQTTSQLIFDDIHIEEAATSARNWKVYWNCFEAIDDFEYLSIVGPNKLFDELNECMEVGLPGFQHFTGYAVDYIQLYEIPKTLDTVMALCNGTSIFSINDLLEGPFLKRATFTWDDGLLGGERIFDKEGAYVLNMELSCTTIPIKVEIVAENCDVMIFVPNVFSIKATSPNNEVRPILKSDFPIEDYRWSIYDRWGNLVFATDQLSQSWNGIYNGRFLDEGVYMWQIEYAINNAMIREEAIGSITLLK